MAQCSPPKGPNDIGYAVRFKEIMKKKGANPKKMEKAYVCLPIRCGELCDANVDSQYNEMVTKWDINKMPLLNSLVSLTRSYGWRERA